MNRTPPRTLAIVMVLAGGGLAIRLVAAVLVERARPAGKLCLFDDTAIYWRLAEAIRLGRPYEVDQYGEMHRALRTPGYPLFLAACQVLFGASAPIGARLVQAALDAACVPMVFAITRRALPGCRDRVAVVAAALAAFEPYWVGLSALLLSEAVFVPLMLLMLWGMAALWDEGESPRGRALVALGTGLAAGASVLVKPSWALAVPAVLIAWMVARRDGRAFRGAAIVCLGVVMAMAPWWVRNAGLYGTFVPTAVWAGASLYDGLNPSADGSSDMRFLASPEFARLGEVEQDQAFRDRALAFARDHPGRVARLAAIKAGRFWSPWPNAKEFRATATNLASAAVTVPLFALLALGAWRHRRNARALVLLAGPLLYFFALHLIFVSSIRYRIPAEVPAFGLMAAAYRKPRTEN